MGDHTIPLSQNPGLSHRARMFFAIKDNIRFITQADKYSYNIDTEGMDSTRGEITKFLTCTTKYGILQLAACLTEEYGCKVFITTEKGSDGLVYRIHQLYWKPPPSTLLQYVYLWIPPKYNVVEWD